MDHNIFEQPLIDLELPSLATASPSTEVSLISFPSSEDRIRYFLKQYSLTSFDSFFSDLGDLSESFANSPDIIPDLVQERAHLPIVITSKVMTESLGASFLQHFHRPTFVRNNAWVSDEYHHIGLQGHLIEEDWIWDQDKHLRLGDLTTSIESAEVFLRNADYIDIDLNVLRLSDNPQSDSPSTAGLNIETLCLIAKYIGASTQLKAITISGYDDQKDINGIGARNIAMIIWYILDGYKLRLRELGAIDQEKTYTVLPDNVDGELTFIENQNTGRWWVKLNSELREEAIRMACSKEDYEAACQNEISDRVTSLLARI